MKKTGTILLAALAACILFSGCAAEAPRAESPTSAPAASSESAPPASQPEASENAREGPGEEAPEPVSYTHLDVYKRQSPRNKASKSFRRE